ncbi:MAG: bifunctional riboflavin kinase/FAD synthetase [Desulfobacterales bacterium]|nr:bifunctional riboflavin kinase/FAD synthetase [Desulfobacterales bacterium]
MKLIEDLNIIQHPFENAVITIGNFDGVHMGHQALFHQVIERAEAVGGTSIAMTFEPHPIRVLKKNGDPPLITIYQQKVELIEAAGMDVLIAVPFTEAFAAMGAREFVEDLLVGRIGIKTIVVGNDYTFGRNREGTLGLLRQFAKEMNFEVVVAQWIQRPNTMNGRISSTMVRELISDGEMEKARKLLGRHYQIRGTVTTGRNRGGKLLGFPTANINLQDELCPKTGVYAVTVESAGELFKGVANIGYSPTFDDYLFTIEVHLLDFDKNIYDALIRVNFIERIRDEKKFNSIEALSDQIRQDIVVAEGLLAD